MTGQLLRYWQTAGKMEQKKGEEGLWEGHWYTTLVCTGLSSTQLNTVHRITADSCLQSAWLALAFTHITLFGVFHTSGKQVPEGAIVTVSGEDAERRVTSSKPGAMLRALY